MDTLLPEDYVTCIAEDDTGLLWVGFRQQGYVAIDPKTSKHIFEGNKKADGLPDDYAFTILPTADSRPWLGTYGGGLGQAKSAMKGPGAKGAAAALKPPEKPVPMPKAAKPPTVTELKAKAEEIRAASAAKPAAMTAVALPDDWRTQGNFYGDDKYINYRYGEWRGYLCAVASPFDASWGRQSVSIVGRIGENRTKDDSLRRWVHWKQTDNVRTLKNPYLGYRRQAEWDDHGEAYPMSHEGPHLYVNVDVPPGVFYLSFYIFNKDGHNGNNRFRDFLITVKPYSKTDPDFLRAPTLAQGRVQTFWGGVYKVFAVQGGRNYTIQVHDNWSFNTILSGIFVDPILDPPEERLYMDDIPRVKYTFQPDEVKGLAKLATDQPESTSWQGVGLLGAMEQWRATSALGFAQEGRRNGLIGGRATRGAAAKDDDAVSIRRARAEFLNQLRLFDERDAIYRILAKQ